MLWDIAWRNMWQRWLRSLLTILGVAMAVQLYVTMSGIMLVYEQDLQKQLSAFAGKVIVQQPMGEEGSDEEFPSPSSSIEGATADDLLTLEEIDRNSSSALLFVPLARAPGPNLPPAVMAVGIEPGHEAAYLGSFQVESGEADLARADSVILGRSAAHYYQEEGVEGPVAPGETIEIQGQTFSVAGVLESAPNLFSQSVLMPLSTAQSLFRRPDVVSAVVLTAGNVEDTAAISAQIQTRFPGLAPSTQDDIAENANKMLEGQRLFFAAIKDTVIIVAGVVITIVVVVAVMERRREIGTLRAIGARRSAIFSLVVGESLTLSLVGAIMALPLAFVMNWVLGFGDFADVPPAWLGSILATVIVGVLASLLPAWQAVRVDPLEALRYE
jgi:putative ABC transport system permease protein